MALSNANLKSDFVVVVHTKKLYHLKGKNSFFPVAVSDYFTGEGRIIVVRVDPIVPSLNNGDVFILDAGKKIFVWCGLKANQREKKKGVHLAGLVRVFIF